MSDPTRAFDGKMQGRLADIPEGTGIPTDRVISVDDLDRERKERETALSAALRLVAEYERWGPTEVIEFADYIRTGEHPNLAPFMRPSPGHDGEWLT